MYVIVGNVVCTFLKTSWSLICIGCCPPPVRCQSFLYPFIVFRINKLFSSQILSIFQPILLENSAAMSSVTAKAALFSCREDNISLFIGSDLIARSGQIGQDWSTESIISSISPVNSFSVVISIVKHLSIDHKFCSVDNVGLVERDLERATEYRWILGEDGTNEDDRYENFDHTEIWIMILLELWSFKLNNVIKVHWSYFAVFTCTKEGLPNFLLCFFFLGFW